MIFNINHLFDIILILPLLYIIWCGFSHIYLDYKRTKPTVNFEDLIKQKEQLLMLSLGEYSLNQSSNTYDAYQKLDSPENDKILQIFKGLQWGEGPFQREAIEHINKEFGIKTDLLTITNAFKFLIRHELLISRTKLPGFTEVLRLTSLVALYNILKNEEGLNSFSMKKNIKAKSLKQAYAFQIKPRQKSKEFEKELITLIKSERDILQELLLYTKVVEKLTNISPLKSNQDLAGALKIMGFKENPSKEEIKKRYRNLALAQHPDTFSGIDIPANLLRKASENFNQINMAYKLLLKKIT